MSTLHVENLKGLSSGGNANKIIVPSGQTIDASAGTLVPSAGQVIQVKHNASVDRSAFNTTLATGTTVYTGPTITPLSTSSKILILAQHTVENGAATAGTIDGTSYIYTSIYEGSTNLAASGSGYTGTMANAAGYQSPKNSRQHFSGSILYSPNSTNALTFYIKCSGGSNINAGYWLFYGLGMTVMEIAG